MSDPLRAMVLAAGYGSRLAPITDHLPKPLLPVRGQPLLDGIIDRILAAGFGPVAVNSHHRGEMLAAHLAGHPRRVDLVHFPEAEILGTGGALANAREFLGAGAHFLVYNGDVLCDVDLKALVDDHLATGARATLLLADWPAVNSVRVAADGRIRHFGGVGDPPPAGDGDRRLTYAGIGVFARDLLPEFKLEFSSLIPPLDAALRQDANAVRGFCQPEASWNDLGTLDRWLAVAGQDAVTGAGFRLNRITGHGSERRFWRLGIGDWSAVAMVDPEPEVEFGRFVAVARFLAATDLGAPALLSVAEPSGALLAEDLGTQSLYELATSPATGSEVLRARYTAVVEHLLALQAATDDARRECPAAVDRCLDLAQLRWETRYFSERFLRDHLGWPDAARVALEPEFAALAEFVARIPLTLIHRDFQSQNILLQDDAVRLVDFQGMRLGPATYDLASLLWDPYVALPPELRQDLVARFAAGYPRWSRESVAGFTVAAGLQRVMQALGAFGFLGHSRGKRGFWRHIPAGLRHLGQLLALLPALAGGPDGPPSLPGLTRLVREIQANDQIPDDGAEHD